MGESGSRRTDETPASGSGRSKAALVMFLAATFGLMALLSVPVARFLPAPLRVPRVIQRALSPLEPILPPFLRDASRPRAFQGVPLRVVALNSLGRGPGLGSSSAGNPSSVGGAPPPARPSSSPARGPSNGDEAHGLSTPPRGKAGDRRSAMLADGKVHGGGKKDAGGMEKAKGKDDERGKDDGRKAKKPKPDKK